MAINAPVQTVKKMFENKAKLVSSIVSSCKREGESDAEASERLKSVSNKKLLRLSEIAKQISERGGREQVIAAIGTALGRVKDKDYLNKLGGFSNGRLMDMFRATTKSKKKS